MADETRTIAWQLVVETKGIEQNTASAASSLGELSKGFQFLKTTIAGIAAGAVAKTFQDLSDTLTRVQNDIRKVTSSTAEFAAVQDALMVSARGSYTSIETVATNYRALKTSLEGYAVSARQVIQVQDTVTKGVKLAGGSAEDAEAMIKRLAVAFETGTVSSRDLTSIAREMPDVFKAIAASTDGGAQGLRQLAKDGKLTGQDLLDSLGGAADKINQQFANRIPTIGEAFTTLKTSLVSVFAEFDKATGISALLSKAILALADDVKDIPNQLRNIAINVQEMFNLAVENVTNFFKQSLNVVKEWIGKIGGFFAKAIPDFIPGAATIKKFYSDLENNAVSANAKLTVAHDNATRAITMNAAKQRAALAAPPDTGMLDEITVVGQRMDAAGKASDAFLKAMQALRAEQGKATDGMTALNIEIRDGAQASKEYSIAAEARRKIDEQIQTMLEKKDITAAQAEQLRALSGAVAAANVELARYQNAWSVVKGVMDEGKTSTEKAAEKVAEAEKAFALLAASGKLSADQIKEFNKGLQDLRDKADPVVVAQKEIDKWMTQQQETAAKLAIQNQALSISLRNGDEAARAYVNSAEARLDVDKQLAALALAQTPATEKQAAAMYKAADAAAAAKTANEQLANAQKLVTQAAGFGLSAQDQMRVRLEETNRALAEMKLDPAAEAQVKAGMERMAASVDPVKNAFADAAKSMGQSLVNFVIDGTQSFSEFAASVIKDIGSIIAQMFMMQAIKAAFGGSSMAGLFAQGGVFDRGKVVPFQQGGVVDSAVTFPLRGGARGLMGEAGPEAVMPLARLPGGDLGVKAQPMNLQLINNTGVNATARVRQDADRTQLILEAAELGATMAQTRFNNSVSSGYGASATNMQRTYGLTRRKA